MIVYRFTRASTGRVAVCPEGRLHLPTRVYLDWVRRAAGEPPYPQSTSAFAVWLVPGDAAVCSATMVPFAGAAAGRPGVCLWWHARRGRNYAAHRRLVPAALAHTLWREYPR